MLHEVESDLQQVLLNYGLGLLPFFPWAGEDVPWSTLLLYIGFERYADSANDQNLWIDDVVLSKQRIGCDTPKRGGDR